jgi:hypothetical protein
MKIHFVEIGDDFVTFWGNPLQEVLDAAIELYKRLPPEIQAKQSTPLLNNHNPAKYHTNLEPGVVPWKDDIGAIYRHFHVTCDPKTEADIIINLLPEAIGVPKVGINEPH